MTTLSESRQVSIPSSIVMDKNEMFKSVDGQYKVKDVKVYNRKTGLYEDLDLEKEYQLGAGRINIENLNY